MGFVISIGVALIAYGENPRLLSSTRTVRAKPLGRHGSSGYTQARRRDSKKGTARSLKQQDWVDGMTQSLTCYGPYTVGFVMSQTGSGQ